MIHDSLANHPPVRELDAHRLMSGLFASESPRLLLLARRMLGAADAAEDVVQEAFLAAWRSLHAFRGESSHATWLYAITVRTALSALRRRAGDGALELLDERILDAVTLGEATNSASHIETVDLERAIAQLSDGQRTAFVLRDIEGFSTTEAARVMDVAEGTVKAQLFHARRRLARSLRAYRHAEETSHD